MPDDNEPTPIRSSWSEYFERERLEEAKAAAELAPFIAAAKTVCEANAWKTAAYPLSVEVNTPDWDAAVALAKHFLEQNGVEIPEKS